MDNYNYDSPIRKSYKLSASTSPSVNSYSSNNKSYKTTISFGSANKTTKSVSSCDTKYVQAKLISNKDKLLKNRDDAKILMEDSKKKWINQNLFFGVICLINFVKQKINMK